MKKNTKIILIILPLLVIGGGLYYYFFLRDIPEITQVTDSQEVDETANWSVYTNEKIGYSIKYPPGWYLHKEGYNPPQPTQVFFLTVPEGKTKDTEYSSISIFADKILTEKLKDYQEIANLTLNGYERSKIEFAGREAIRLDSPKDNSGSIYFKKSYYIIRINWSSTDPVLDERHKDVFEKILNTFEEK